FDQAAQLTAAAGVQLEGHTGRFVADQVDSSQTKLGKQADGFLNRELRGGHGVGGKLHQRESPAGSTEVGGGAEEALIASRWPSRRPVVPRSPCSWGSTFSIAIAPSSWRGTETVESGGQACCDAVVSPKPTIVRSPGIS